MPRLVAVSLALGTTFLATAPARAATLTWWATGSAGSAGGAGTWDTSSVRWTANGSTWSAWTNPTSPPDTAVFGGAVAGSVTLSAGVTVGGLTFNTTGYTISGSTLTLAGETATATVNTTSATISSIVAGTAALQKAGSGRLWLSATNSYTGGTILNSGILQFSTDSLGPSGTVTLNGGTLRWNSGNNQDIFSRVVLASGSTATLDTFFNSISTSANLGTAGNTASLVKTGGGVLALTGSTLYTGSTSVAQGTLIFGTSAARGTGMVTVANDATLGLRLNAGFTTADFVNLQANALSGVSMGSAAIAGIDTNGIDATLNSNLGGTVGVAKMGTGKLTLTGTLTYTGPTAIDAGSLAFGGNYSSTNQLRFGSTGGVTTAGTLDLSTTSGTFGSMLVQIYSSSNTATAFIGSGQTLAIYGNVTVGFDNLAPTPYANWAQTRFAASGSGTFAQIVTGGTFQVAVAAAYNRNPSVADFSNLGTLVIDHGTTSGAVIIGEDNVMNDPSQSVLSLAATSTITTNLIHVGRGANNDTTIRTLLHLGTSSNILNTNILNIGGTSAAARNSATMSFLTASGSLRLRGADGVGRATVNVLNDPATSTSGDMAGTFDVSGHYADLLVGTLTIGVRGNSSRGYGSGALAFDQGTFDASTVVMAQKSGSGSGRSTAVMTLGGGTTMFGSLTMSVNTSSASTTTSGTLSLLGGSLFIGTGSGTAVNMATAVAGGTANSLLSLTGGTATITGDIIRSGSAGTETARLLLDGARLNMSGFVIGTAAAGVALDLRSGTLENLGGYNGGAGLTKTTSGTLTLSGSNSYSGATTIAAGVLALGNGSALAGGGLITFTGGTLRFSALNTADYGTRIKNSTSAIALDTNGQSLTVAGIIDATNNAGLTKFGAGRLTLSGNNSYTGVTTISGGTLALSGSGSIGTGGLNLGTTASPGAFDLAALVSGTYFLPATGDLAGVGTLAGDGKTLAVLGSFLPGNSSGTVTVGTGFTLDLSQSGTSMFQITSPLYTPGTFDLVNGTGSVIFGGVLNLSFSGGTFANGTDVLQIFANTGGRFGDFTSVVATGLDDGQYATFNPATGTISVVPEPATYAMALAGIACSGFSMWRRRKRACLAFAAERERRLLGSVASKRCPIRTCPSVS